MTIKQEELLSIKERLAYMGLGGFIVMLFMSLI